MRRRNVTRQDVATLPQPNHTPTHRRHAQDEGKDVQKLLGKAKVLCLCCGPHKVVSLPADIVEEASRHHHIPPCFLHVLPTHTTTHTQSARLVTTSTSSSALSWPRRQYLCGLQSQCIWSFAPFMSVIILIPTLPSLPHTHRPRALPHAHHTRHTMGDSVRDMMRQAAKDKQRKADALAAALKNSKGKEQVGGVGYGVWTCVSVLCVFWPPV